MNEKGGVQLKAGGAAGLIRAIINRATLDAQGRIETNELSRADEIRADALEYFAGEEYQKHLRWLGLDEMQPIPEAHDATPERKAARKARAATPEAGGVKMSRGTKRPFKISDRAMITAERRMKTAAADRRRDYKKRKADMKTLRFVGGMTLQAIGDIFGLSRQGVNQIMGNTGYRTGYRAKSRPEGEKIETPRFVPDDDYWFVKPGAMKDKIMQEVEDEELVKDD